MGDNTQKQTPNSTELLILLGYKNTPDGKLHAISQQRANTALAVAQHTRCRLLCTGGFGSQFNQSSFPHGLLLQEYLQQQGIASQRFLPPALSRNTYEDGKFSTGHCQQYNIRRILLVTSDFHVQRGYLWLRHFNPGIAIHCCPAPTPATEPNIDALLAHERQAVAQFYRDFPDTPPLTQLYDWQSLGIAPLS